MPSATPYNGNLVIWAHGFQDAGTPVRIPEEQMQLDETTKLADIINNLGFGFATNSYSKTGLAIRQGMADILDLVKIFTNTVGAPNRIYLVGASEGGIITTLLLEQHPDIFDAGLAACGPVGDFPSQINYFGDSRATFEYFFPSLIPGDPFNPPQVLIDNWRMYYDTVVKPELLAPRNRDKFNQWVRTARLPYDEADYLNTVEGSARDVLNYAVINLLDASDVLNGFPFDNTTKVYSGSDDDLLLNQMVHRVRASDKALREMRTYYNTTGVLQKPLVTIHTTRDQQIPFWHEYAYLAKTIWSGSFISRHFNITVDRYGHCSFEVPEILVAFAVMLLYDGLSNPMTEVRDALPITERAEYDSLVDRLRRSKNMQRLRNHRNRR